MRIPSICLCAVAILLVAAPSYCIEFRPIVVVYDGTMKGFAEGVAALLNSSMDQGEEVVVVTDPSIAASLLALPNLKCLVLTSVGSGDLTALVGPVTEYFRSGGSAIGFYGCSWQTQVGDLARSVFPAFGNATGSGTRKAGVYVNEYVRGDRLAGFGESLPDSVDLVGQFFAYATDKDKKPIDVDTATGSKTVLFREKKTGSPLVIAYEGGHGGRSATLTGLFLREQPTAESYYGKLLEQPEFHTLLSDAYHWVSEGNVRFQTYSANYQEVIGERGKAQDELVARSEEKRQSRTTNWLVLLGAFWALGMVCIAAMVRWSFFGHRPAETPNP